MAEVKRAADSLREMYRGIAADDLRSAKIPQEQCTAVIKTASMSDEHGPMETKSASTMLKASSDRAKAAAAKPTTSKKRKADQPTMTLEEEITAYKKDLSDIDVIHMYVDMNCDQVRKRIRSILDGSIMTKGEFCDAIGSSNHSVNTFLGKRGSMEGSSSEAYTNAWAWFKQRDLVGLKMPDVKKRQKADAAAAAAAAAAAGSDEGPASKKSKTVAASIVTPDMSVIHLDGEEDDSVPVFDSADEIRKKISAHLKTPGLTQAQFCRDLYAQLKAPTCKAIQTKQLNDFRGKKGPLAGCTSSVFYAAYVLFEKLRLAKGKPKSAHRQEMERAHPRGLDREHDGRHG